MSFVSFFTLKIIKTNLIVHFFLTINYKSVFSMSVPYSHITSLSRKKIVFFLTKITICKSFLAIAIIWLRCIIFMCCIIHGECLKINIEKVVQSLKWKMKSNRWLIKVIRVLKMSENIKRQKKHPEILNRRL